ncbi:hypothetical protein CJF30_00011119 [Rutstroemia sp. NJR-2017a BBW]|nr:hypothetical protein CJF30_00011119 [Rutstroemia sp. NJR-2017a BBW]
MALSQFIGGHHFTSKLGVEVRHIGFWDGTVQGDTQSEVVRRKQFPEGVIPAFALKLYGQEVHFAYTGDDADGNSIFKIGNGPGPATEENKRRIKSRNSGDSIPLFNNYFFDQGGLDMVATSDIDNAGQGIIPDVRAISKQLKLKGRTTPFSLTQLGYGFRYTTMRILWLKPEGGLNVNETCSTT